MKKRVTILLILIISITTISLSHSGRTDSSGGHYDSSTGEYHYHNAELVSNEENYIVSKDDDESIEINRLNQKIEELQSQIDTQEENIETLNNQIDEKDNEILSLKEENKNTWIVCIIIFLIGIYIAYKVGEDKK